MNWIIVSAVAEIAAALAVVLSLAYLARQVNDSVAQSRITNYHRIFSEFSQLQNMIASSAETTAILRRGLTNLAELNPDEKLRFSALVLTMFRGWEAAHRYHSRGWVEAELWVQFDVPLREWVSYPGIGQWWELRQEWFTADFRRAIDAYREEAGGQSAKRRDRWPATQPE